jgi:hypothetical protein
VSVQDLTAAGAKATAELCGQRRTSDPIDVSVVLLSRQVGRVIATSDPDDLRALDPSSDLVEV